MFEMNKEELVPTLSGYRLTLSTTSELGADGWDLIELTSLLVSEGLVSV